MNNSDHSPVKLAIISKDFRDMVRSEKYKHIERILFRLAIKKFFSKNGIKVLRTPPGWVDSTYDYKLQEKVCEVDFDNRFICSKRFVENFYYYLEGHRRATNSDLETMQNITEQYLKKKKKYSGLDIDIIQRYKHCGYCGKSFFGNDQCRGEYGYSRNEFQRDLAYHEKNVFYDQQRGFRVVRNNIYSCAQRKDGIYIPLVSQMTPPKISPSSILQFPIEYEILAHCGWPRVVNLCIQNFGLDFIFDYNIPVFRHMLELYKTHYIMGVMPVDDDPHYFNQLLVEREKFEGMYFSEPNEIIEDKDNDSDFECNTIEEDDPGYSDIEFGDPEPPRKRKKMKR